MKISFRPAGHPLSRITALSVTGDTLSIAWREGREDHAQTLDFGALAEGAQLPAVARHQQGCARLVADRRGHKDRRRCAPWRHAAPRPGWAPEAARFPQPVTLTKGAVALPDCDGPLLVGPVPTSRALPDPYDPTLP